MIELTPVDGVPGATLSILVGIAATIGVIYKLSKGPNLDAIPTVGSNSWLGSWRDGFKFHVDGVEIIQEGYEKYKTVPFKVAAGYWWFVVLSDRKHLDELRKAPGDTLSAHEALNELSKTKHIFGGAFADNPHHVEAVISRLTRSIASLHHEILDEISVSFDEVLNLKDHEWKSVPALATIQKVVCRTSNRLFVGLPLCRDPDWSDMNLRYTLDAAEATRTLLCFPGFLTPLVARFLTKIREGRRRATNILAPVVEERLRLMEMHGKDYEEKPNDMISWLLDLADGGLGGSVDDLATRITSINFAAIHTSSNSFTHALFYLAANPQYMQPLREEVETVVEKDGWSKASLEKMRKVDSFLKECQRLAGIATVALLRKAITDYTFSDGTFIPKGTLIIAPSGSLHLDDTYYPNARTFDPFRFSDMREQDGESTKHQFASTSLEYLPFGHGKYACPGRFFAANELKSMLAYIVATYDVKLEDQQARPEGLRLGVGLVPDPTAKVMFRKRVH